MTDYEAKGRIAAFGEVNVIFVGGFAQLPPIDMRKARMGSTSRAQGAGQGNRKATLAVSRHGSDSARNYATIGFHKDALCRSPAIYIMAFVPTPIPTPCKVIGNPRITR